MEHDTRGYIENDDLKELFHDPTKNDLDQFGSNFSVIVKSHIIPSDKLGISPKKERF